MALESGYNVALMAPTEILAEQHFQTFTRWFAPLRIGVELQTGSHKTANPGEPPPTAMAEGVSPRPVSKPRLFIGTHALIEDRFALENLGLVIIDEQHRFGVAQREKLVRKGAYPHLLIMTATPIPRTLGLTLYGDLDVSIIRRPPPGRGRIRTFVRGLSRLPQVWDFIREKLAQGRQAFVICPRVEENGLDGIKAVTREFDVVQNALAPLRVGLLHGRLRPAEKEEVMAAFRAGAQQVLVSTSVVEVGVDVPNATIMLIENAEQFGLAQLHQLRGRIGRGAHDSYCILLGGAKGEEARQRLNILEKTTDGFEIAEADLKFRGSRRVAGSTTKRHAQTPFWRPRQGYRADPARPCACCAPRQRVYCLGCLRAWPGCWR